MDRVEQRDALSHRPLKGFPTADQPRAAGALGRDALDVLHKLPMARQTDIDDYSETKFNFSTLVPAWPELNRASFWYEVEKGREWLDKSRGERLTEFSQVLVSCCFSRFDETDFEYALDQIGEQTSPDDQLVTLSLAFRLYVCGGRERKQRERLKKAVAGDSELAERLANYLKPQAQGRQSLKRMEASLKRRSEKWERKQAQNRDEWRSTLQANADKLRDSGLKPGLVSRHQWYVHELAREKHQRLTKLTSGNWKCLVKDFGEEVAQSYRDGVVRFWREHTPTLRSEGAPANIITVAVIFGLTGLQIESNETSGWPKVLSPEEVELACRYASFELNGLPTWFAALYSLYPSIVSSFLLREICFELSIEKADVESHYILSDISYSGQWAWNELAPEIYKILKAKEPDNLSNLDRLLKIVQGSTISDGEVAKLASRKSRVLKQLDHAAQWFSSASMRARNEPAECPGVNLPNAPNEIRPPRRPPIVAPRLTP